MRVDALESLEMDYDVLATMYRHLGIDPRQTFLDHSELVNQSSSIVAGTLRVPSARCQQRKMMHKRPFRQAAHGVSLLLCCFGQLIHKSSKPCSDVGLRTHSDTIRTSKTR